MFTHIAIEPFPNVINFQLQLFRASLRVLIILYFKKCNFIVGCLFVLIWFIFAFELMRKHHTHTCKLTICFDLLLDAVLVCTRALTRSFVGFVCYRMRCAVMCFYFIRALFCFTRVHTYCTSLFTFHSNSHASNNSIVQIL